jgi:hypothetical protein
LCRRRLRVVAERQGDDGNRIAEILAAYPGAYPKDLQGQAVNQLQELEVEVRATVHSHVTQILEDYFEVSGQRIVSDMVPWTVTVQPSLLGRKLGLGTDRITIAEPDHDGSDPKKQAMVCREVGWSTRQLKTMQ